MSAIRSALFMQLDTSLLIEFSAERTCAGGGVSEVTNAHEAGEIEYTLAVLEHMAGHAIAFTLITVASYQHCGLTLPVK